MKLEQAARSALEALEALNPYPASKENQRFDAITALREALAEQAEQEPVAWAYEYGTDRGDAVNEIRWYPNLTALDKPKPVESGSIRNVRPLYAAPVRTKDLTDAEICEIGKATHSVEGDRYLPVTFARAVIAADREKNK